MIYVPNLEDYECFVVKDSETIRAYENEPIIGENVSYRDYYINSHYVYSDGLELITNVPICLNSSNLTAEVYYRNDFDSILIIFSLLAIICFYIPTKIVLKMFKKR